MIRIYLIITLLFGAFVWWRWRLAKDDVARRELIRKAMLYGVFLAILLLAISGRIHWLGAVFAALLPLGKFLFVWLVKLFPILSRVYQTHGNTQAGGTGRSRLNTRFLKMTFDQQQGKLQGTVLNGPFEGNDLDSLSKTELNELLEFYRSNDAESAHLLASYLSRRFGTEYGDADASMGAFSSRMTAAEAREVLNVAQDASVEDIKNAHKSLIQKLHPDRGGNDYFAAKINQARDLLLKERT